MPRRNVPRFPCGKCKANCLSECLYCSGCDSWYHSRCESMTRSILGEWSGISLDYICVSCRSLDIQGQEFDYVGGMHRLKEAASTKSMTALRLAAQREALFNATLKTPQEPVSEFPELDASAAQLMDKYVDGIQGVPRKTTGDGNCLFNALSVLISGNEALSVSLRYHTSLNLINKQNTYLKHPLRRDIQNFSSDYEDACLSVTEIGNESDSWTILALADTIETPIRVIYPAANGKKDRAFQALNTVFTPPGTNHTNAELAVLWHRMGCLPVVGRYYLVNHFTAVTDTESLPRVPHSLGFLQEEDLTQPESPPTEDSLTWRLPKRRRVSSNSSLLTEEIEMRTTNRYEVLSEPESEVDIESEGDYEDCITDSSVGNIKEDKVDVTDNDNVEVPDNDIVNEVESVKIPNSSGRFISNEQVLHAIEGTNFPCRSIPRGEKNNVFIVVDYSENSGRCEFVDDCGVWEAGTTVNQYFNVSEKSVTAVYKRNDVFCRKKVVNKKLEFIPLEPQPTNVITIHRYYAQLKGEDKYRRRISLISETPEHLVHLRMKCVVEYIGKKIQKNNSHGNSQSGEAYTRTDPAIIRAAASQVGEKKATGIVDDMANQNSPNAPKSARQVQDRIHYINKKKTNNNTKKHNLADDMLCILGQINDSDFIQEIVFTKNKEPVVILYNENQIKNMKANCEGKNGSVICIDRTFNLGRFFITATCYKNRTVINRKTNQFPIFIGPICIQWDGQQVTYSKFFNHLREKLGTDNFTFGTDDEPAMRNALKISFPNSDFLLCTKHIKDNIKHNLVRNGTNEKTIQKIISAIFNTESGLVFSKDDFGFQQREEDLSVFFEEFPHFRKYYNNYLGSKLKKFVYSPLKQCKITKLWTNNNAESINNRMKQETNHKLMSAPDLIEKLYVIPTSQLTNLRRAIYGSGNYKLFGTSEKYLMDENDWHSLNSGLKQKRFEKILTLSIGKEMNSGLIKSTDGTITIKKPNTNAGKKPGQRRRPTAERTTTRHR